MAFVSSFLNIGRYIDTSTIFQFLPLIKVYFYIVSRFGQKWIDILVRRQILDDISASKYHSVSNNIGSSFSYKKT